MMRTSFLTGFALTVSAYAIAALSKRYSKHTARVPVSTPHRRVKRS